MEYPEVPRWYFALDGLSFTASVIGVIVSILFLLTVFVHRRECHSVANLISCNTQLAIFLLSGITLYSMILVLNSDVHHVKAFDSLCIWRSYFVYTEIASIYYSFVTQSYYRYVRVIHAARSRYSSATTVCILMIVEWMVIHGLMLFLPLTGQIEFESGSQMCSMLLSRYSVVWSLTVLIYLPACFIVTLVYIRVVMFIKKSRMRVMSGVSLRKARRELEVIKRMGVVLFIFSVSGVPYSVYAILAVIDMKMLPVHYNRIITFFNTAALASASSIILVQSADVHEAIIRLIRMRNRRRVHPLPPLAFVHTLVK